MYPLMLTTAVATAAGSLCDDDGEWRQVWADEFDKGLNLSVWSVAEGPGGGLCRLANCTAEDVYTEDGMLVLRSRELPGGKNWTTGAVVSKPGGSVTGMSWQYGRFCVRARLPGAGPGKSQGLWPAHWMLPIDHARKCGYNEMDIMEMIDGDGTAWGTYWYWGNHSSPPRPHCIDGPPVRAGDAGVQVPDYYTAFHEYAIEWTPTSLKYIFDGSPYKSYTDPSMLPVNNHYWLLNSAVGGTWPGSPNVQTVFPAYHHIDYVRVSQKKSY